MSLLVSPYSESGEFEDLQDLDLEIDKQIGELIYKVTCQLFLEGRKSGYSPVGKGILTGIGLSSYFKGINN